MTPADKQEFEDSLAKVLDKHRGVDQETHKEHHKLFPRVLAYIDSEIDAREEKKAFSK